MHAKGRGNVEMNSDKKVFECKKIPITYTLIRKQVKNINLRITSHGEVVVSANPLVSIDQVDEFVASKGTWIAKHQQNIEDQQKHCVISHDMIVLFGNTLKIKRTIAKLNQVSYDDKFLYVQHKKNTDPNNVIKTFIDQTCKDVFTDVAVLTCDLLKDYKLTLPEIKVRDMKSKWGSCIPAKHSITLNKKLIHYPFGFIEYVILHEFVHFIQPDHSKRFYDIIQYYMPDYKERIALVH